MKLTPGQKTNLCRRYWENNETYLKAKKRKGFETLHESDFKKATDVWSFTYRNLYPPKSLEWMNKEDDNSTLFVTMTEEEIFNQLCKTKGNALGIKWKK